MYAGIGASVFRHASVSPSVSSQPSVSFSSFSEKISILPEGVVSALASGSSRNFFMEMVGAYSRVYTPIFTASSHVGSFSSFSRDFSYSSFMARSLSSR